MTTGFEPVVYLYEGLKAKPGTPGYIEKFESPLFDELNFDLPLVKEVNKYTLAVTYSKNSTAEWGEF